MPNYSNTNSNRKNGGILQSMYSSGNYVFDLVSNYLKSQMQNSGIMKKKKQILYVYRYQVHANTISFNSVIYNTLFLVLGKFTAIEHRK